MFVWNRILLVILFDSIWALGREHMVEKQIL